MGVELWKSEGDSVKLQLLCASVTLICIWLPFAHRPLRFFQAFQEVHWRQVFCEVFDEIHVQISDRMTFVIRIFFEASLEIGLCGKRGNDSQ